MIISSQVCCGCWALLLTVEIFKAADLFLVCLPSSCYRNNCWQLKFVLCAPSIYSSKNVFLKYRGWVTWCNKESVLCGLHLCCKILENLSAFGILEHKSLQYLNWIATEWKLWLRHLRWNFQMLLKHWIVWIASWLCICCGSQSSIIPRFTFSPELWSWWRILECKIGFFSSSVIIQTSQPPNFLYLYSLSLGWDFIILKCSGS